MLQTKLLSMYTLFVNFLFKWVYDQLKNHICIVYALQGIFVLHVLLDNSKPIMGVSEVDALVAASSKGQVEIPNPSLVN